MGFLDKGVTAIEDTLAYLARYWIGKDFAGYCELATAVGLTEEDIKRHPGLKDPYIVVDNKLALLTSFDVQGTYQILSDQDFGKMIDNLRVKMNGYMKRYGHSITFGFERDPDRSLDELMRLAEPQINAARRIGLKSEDIILDRVLRNAPLVAWEQNLMIVYTHMNVMSPEEMKRELKERSVDAQKHKLPRIEFGQNPASVLMAMKYRHDTMVDRVRHDFERSGSEGRPVLGYLLLKTLPSFLRGRVLARVANFKAKGFAPQWEAVSVIYNRYVGFDPKTRKALYVDVNDGTETLVDFDNVNAWELDVEKNKPALLKLLTRVPALPVVGVRIDRRKADECKANLIAIFG